MTILRERLPPDSVRPRIMLTALGANLLGALVTFFYFHYIDVTAVQARPTLVEILYFRA